MSVRDEITRLETAKSDIETAIETCGVNVPDTEKISAYASYIRQIPSAIFSELNAGPFGGEDAFIRTIEQTDGIIEATTGGLVSSSLSGLAPKIGTDTSVTISKQADEWVLASTKGATPTWRKLPANAFKNDNTNTTYTLSGALSGNTFVSTLTPSSGTATTSIVPAMSKATSSAAGTAGLVPAPAKGEQSKFLRGDGTWQTPSNTVPSALCTTAAATAAKAASFTYFAATAKRYFQINFRYANSASGALTLNVNSTGAKPIYINGSASSASNCTLPAGPYIAYYDGTNYYINTDGTIPRVSHVGHTHDDIYYTESEINDLLDDYLPIAGGTLTGSLKINTANWGNQLILNRKNNGSNWGPSIKFYADDSGLGALTMGGDELYVSDVSGSTRTALSKVGHTHASNAITALTGYSKATSASAIATTDSLNTALGKLEYKADLGKSAYDWYKSVTADDTDKLINKWGEIVGFLDSVAEGTDILDEFVTRKTDQTITGKKIFNTNTHTKPLVISRTGGLTEAVAIGVNDSQALFEYTNDEASNSFVFKMINTDTESNSGAGANESSVTFTGSSAGSTVQATTFKGKFISTGGTSAKFVKGDGSLDSNSYATTSSLSNYVTLAGAQTITGKKTFSNGLAITGGTTENTSLPYFLGIDAYADGGAVRYLSASKVCAAIGAAKKDGSNATGTWGINISGIAATATTATTATSANSATTASKLDNVEARHYIRCVPRHSGSMDLNKIDSTMSVVTEIRPSEITTTNLPSDYGTDYGCMISARDGNSNYGHGKMQILGCNKKFWMRATQGAGEANDGTWCRLALTSDIPSVGNGTVTINQAGASKGSFTLNQSTAATINLTDTNYYHTPSYSSGLSIASGTGVDDMYVPDAGASQSGVVNTVAQTFAGEKTFSSIRLRSTSTTSYGGYLYFGDGSYSYITEPSDDAMTIYSRQGVTISTSNNPSGTINLKSALSHLTYADTSYPGVVCDGMYLKSALYHIGSVYKLQSSTAINVSYGYGISGVTISSSKPRAGKCTITVTNNSGFSIYVHTPHLVSLFIDAGGDSCHEHGFAYIQTDVMFPKSVSSGSTLSFSVIYGYMHTQKSWNTNDFTRSDDYGGFNCGVYVSRYA